MSKRALWDERYNARELVWSAGPNRLFAEEVRSLTPGTALDVACGEGRNAIWLAEQGWQTTGVDFSAAGINKARQIADKRGVRVEWVTEDVASWSLPASGFDLVAVLYLHTDPAERQKWLPNVLQAVKPGGSFIYIAHDPSNINEGVGGPQDPDYLPGIGEITKALSGFSIQVAEIRRRPVENDPGHTRELQGVALDSYIHARRLTQ